MNQRDKPNCCLHGEENIQWRAADNFSGPDCDICEVLVLCVPGNINP